MNEPLSHILTRAKDVLLTRGWYQGGYERADTKEVCPLGAINALDGCEPGEKDAAAVFLSVLIRQCGYPDVASFNDREGRTPEEILTFLDGAIELAAKQAVVEAVI